MIDNPPSRAPLFRSAIHLAGGRHSPLPPRRLGRGFVFSILFHLSAAAGLFVLSLLAVGPVPAPPILITFVARPPAAPRVVPLRERQEILPKPPPSRRRETPRQRVASLPPVTPPRPVRPRPRPEPPPFRVKAAPVIRIADVEPQLRIRDVVPPKPRDARPTVGPVDSAAPILAGTGEEPELVFLVPGNERPRGTGGGLAGRGNGLPRLPGGGDAYDAGIRSGRDARGGAGGSPVLSAESSFTTTGRAAHLGRRYGATLVEAIRLGRRTHDGSRYALLIPMLTEAYKGMPFRGERRGPSGDAVASVQVDENAVAIRYSDGTLHVIVPSGDGLVALYVSANRDGTAPRSKVDEAARALGVLQRSARWGLQG